MAKLRVWLALVLSVVTTLASCSLGQGSDCMSTLIGLGGVTTTDEVLAILRREELGQDDFYDGLGFGDAQELLRSVGVRKTIDRFRLFKCLNKVSKEDGLICHAQSPCGPGLCVFLNGSHSCKCSSGFTGRNCERELNECDLHHPCLNDGTCHDHVNNFTCSCLEGFYGRRCETDRNECASSPCRHGSCIDVINGFQCDCEAGYTGKVCDEDLDECASFPCQHGTCRDHLNKYSCDCQAGYKGTNCDADINECSSQPCQNQATCHDKVNNFICQCSLGYDGRLCDNEWLTKDILTEQTKLRASVSALQGKMSASGVTAERLTKDILTEQTKLRASVSALQGKMSASGVTAERLTKDILTKQTKLRTSVSALQGKMSASRVTAAYTRWGRTVCPYTATLVYSGYVAGQYHNHNGGASNPLCLHRSPRYARYADHRWGGILYGAVYKMQGQNQPYSSTHENKLAPCVVCAASRKTTTIMIPARNDCPAGWRLEYHGYLLSGHYINRRSQYLCFDDAIEGLSSTGAGGHHLYRVGVHSRYGLPSVYPEPREVTCAVCSK